MKLNVFETGAVFLIINDNEVKRYKNTNFEKVCMVEV
jgi:hypothetical protein